MKKDSWGGVSKVKRNESNDLGLFELSFYSKKEKQEIPIMFK